MAFRVRTVDHRGALGAQPSSDAVVVVIDVIRAFTTAIGAVRGLVAIDCVADLSAALSLVEEDPDLVLFAEDAERPEVTFGLGNSPSRAATADLDGRRAVLCSTNGSPVLGAAPTGTLAAAAVNVTATASWLLTHRPDASIEVWCSEPEGVEDRACAELLAQLLTGQGADVEDCRRAIERGAEEHLVAGARRCPQRFVRTSSPTHGAVQRSTLGRWFSHPSVASGGRSASCPNRRRLAAT